MYLSMHIGSHQTVPGADCECYGTAAESATHDLQGAEERGRLLQSGESAAGVFSGEASRYSNNVRELTAFLQPFAYCVPESRFIHGKQCAHMGQGDVR